MNKIQIIFCDTFINVFILTLFLTVKGIFSY